MKKEYDFRKGRRGPVIEPPPGKTRITIRLDDDVLEWFRAQADASGGASYQTMINQALREFVVSRREPLEEIVRRGVREGLADLAGGWEGSEELVRILERLVQERREEK